VQNVLFMARALGLGRSSDDALFAIEKEAEAALGLPPGIRPYALLSIGYPMGRFGPVRRVPLADVVYEDRWVRLIGICRTNVSSIIATGRLASRDRFGLTAENVWVRTNY
jgi:hypothetical protein